MAHFIHNNKISEKRSFPVSSIFYDGNKIELCSGINKKNPTKITDHNTHIENRCVKKIDEKKLKFDKLIIIILLPPCSECFDEMKKLDVDLEIYFLTDVIRNKVEKKYLKLNEKNINLTQIKFENIQNNRDKIIYLYCVWHLLEAWKNQWQRNPKESSEKKKILKKEREELKEKAKNLLALKANKKNKNRYYEFWETLLNKR